MATLEKGQPKKKRDLVIATLRAMCQDGPLTPDRVIEAAKSPKSPLHSYFTWDVKQAAQSYWKSQARELIRSVEYQIIVEERPVTVSYYVRDPRVEAETQGYVGLDDLKESPDWAKSHVQQELAAVIERLQRAEGYATVLGLHAEVVAVKRSVQKLATRVSGPSLGATP
jgi:hypothetical protein